MTDPSRPSADVPDRTDDLTHEQVAFLNSVFDLARSGDATTVAGYVDRGVPVDLTNANDDTLLVLAAYHEHTDLVAALLAPRGRSRPGQRPGPDRFGDRGLRGLLSNGADLVPFVGGPREQCLELGAVGQ